MMLYEKFSLLILSVILVASCDEVRNRDSEIEEFTNAITGTFSSEDQSKKEVGYTNLTLVNTPIWEDRPGYWIYSENFLTDEPNKVFLQRIINIERIDSITLKTTRYALKKPDTYKNAWKNTDIFYTINKEDLIPKTGCEMYYSKKTSTIYHGQSKPKSCLSELENVAFIMSNIILSEDKISVWVKGYNDSGKQIWGKIKGPYKYIRLK